MKSRGLSQLYPRSMDLLFCWAAERFAAAPATYWPDFFCSSIPAEAVHHCRLSLLRKDVSAHKNCMVCHCRLGLPPKGVLMLKYAATFAERKSTMGCPCRSCQSKKGRASPFGLTGCNLGYDVGELKKESRKCPNSGSVCFGS